MLQLILVAAISGLVIGALARVIVPGRNPMGIFATILVGIGGSFIGGFIGRLLFGARVGGGHFLLSIAGAALIVWLLQRRRPVV